MTTLSPAIEASRFGKSFAGVQALAPLDLVIPRGAIFALVGHNGAGKTTLLKLLMNIFRPTTGSATVLGESSLTLRGPSFAHIGYVSENQQMPDYMTVQGMMDYLRPFYPTWNKELASSLLRDLDLPPNRKLKHLSRGMRMKAALASILAFHPELILMDEPFSGLDPLVRDELIEALLGIVAENEAEKPLTILISSHDLAEIESFATHVGFLHQGHLLFAEPMEILTARFREVTVTLDPQALYGPAVQNLPESWLLPESTPVVFRFVHSRANAEDIDQQIAAILPNAMQIQSDPMTLRTIFLTLVKSSRKEAPQAREKGSRA